MPADHSTPEGRRCPECEHPESHHVECFGCVHMGCHCKQAALGGATPAPVGGVPEAEEPTACISCGTDGFLVRASDTGRFVCTLCGDAFSAEEVPATPTSAEGGEAEGCASCSFPVACALYGCHINDLRSAGALPSPTLAATGGEEHEGDKRALASLSKAWPYLADHASHIDGEFNNAHEYVRRTLALLRRQLAEAERTHVTEVAALHDMQASTALSESAWRERATTAERRLEEAKRECGEMLRAAVEGAAEEHEKQLTASQQEVARLREALAFAASCIKSGESWTPTCAEIIGGALSSPHQSTGQGGGV